jgi:hypothetical protein
MGTCVIRHFAGREDLRGVLAFALAFACLLSAQFAQTALAFYDTPPALNTALQTAAPGDILDLGFSSLPNDLILNQSPTQLSLVAGNLIYSDDPESPSSFGILYSDALPAGSSRIYLYHTNNTPQDAKITAVLKNDTASTANVLLLRKVLPIPSTDYVAAGKTAVREYYEAAFAPQAFAIAPGGAALLDPELDSLIITYEQLAHAIYDLSSDQPLTLFSLILEATSNTLETYASQSLVPNDSHNRQGTFLQWGKDNASPYSYNTSNGIKRLRIASAPLWDTVDPVLSGYNAETGGTATLVGNYGVTYSISVNVASGDGRRLALLLNPRGGAYGGHVRTRFPSTAPPLGQIVPCPIAQVDSQSRGALCAKLSPTATPQTLLIEFMPAGASSMPIELLLVPFSGTSRVESFFLY